MSTPAINPASLRRALAFTRLCKATLVADGDLLQRQAYAEGQAWHSTPDVAFVCRSAVAAMATSSSDTLASAKPMAREFLSLVRAASVLGRLGAGLRRVPANVSMLRTTAGPTAHWRGEGLPAPISALSLARETLGLSTIEVHCIITSELARAAGEDADLVLAAELIGAGAAFEDAAFLDPDSAATADSPASITHAAPSSDSTGGTAAAIRADLKTLIGNFTSADSALERAVLILHPRSALHMALLEGTAGGLAFPDLGVRGGSVCGIPTLTSAACTLSGSPFETFMALIDPSRVLFASDDGVQVETARHASVQMSDAPATGAQQLVNLWQHGLRALKLSIPVAWRAADGVAILRGCAY